MTKQYEAVENNLNSTIWNKLYRISFVIFFYLISPWLIVTYLIKFGIIGIEPPSVIIIFIFLFLYAFALAISTFMAINKFFKKDFAPIDESKILKLQAFALVLGLLIMFSKDIILRNIL